MSLQLKCWLVAIAAALLFHNGTALSQAPDLPATQLKQYHDCRAGNAYICESLGDDLYYGDEYLSEDIPMDDVTARLVYEYACNLGSASGCSQLALLRRNGEGGAVDLAGAKTAQKKACDLGARSAC